MPQRILIVDDEEAILFALSNYFTFAGYQVDSTGNRDKALDLLSKTRYSLVITDLELGEGATEGLKVIDHTLKLYPDVPTILLTAYRTPQVEAQARQRRVKAILMKPIPLAELRRIVNGLLTGSPRVRVD